MSPYPENRLRRLRNETGMRRLVREIMLAKNALIMPFFVQTGTKKKDPIAAMPGQFRFSADQLLFEVEKTAAAGLGGILLFGIPDKKDEKASGAYAADGVVQNATREIKSRFPDVTVIADTCLCEYMSHGHCGIVSKKGNDFEIVNDASLELIRRTAVSQAEAGADMIAPSDMMDGRVAAIREALDANGFSQVPIMSYSAKYASSFYGPFREAAGSAPEFGDRKSYQMDFSNRLEALREIEQDIKEGADIVMVKPALCYLDIIRDAREKFSHPLAAYNVSGEYAYVKYMSSQGGDERAMALEVLTSIKRAGADIIITYHALDAAGWLS